MTLEITKQFNTFGLKPSRVLLLGLTLILFIILLIKYSGSLTSTKYITTLMTTDHCPAKGNLDRFKNLKPTDNQIVNYFKCHHLTPPSILPYNLTSFADTAEQKGTLTEIFNKKKTAGFFIECGAYNGELASNTLILETRKKWQGLLIEASPKIVPILKQKQRSAWVADVCLSPYKWPIEMEFKTTKATYDGWQSSVGKLNLKLAEGVVDPDNTAPDLYDADKSLVECFPLVTIMKAIQVTHVDFFSLDVQGVELKILNTLPWDETLTIDIIQAEYMYDPEGAQKMKEFMEAKGYRVHYDSGVDYIFVKNNLNWL